MAESRTIVPHSHTLGLEFVSPSVEVLGGHYHWTSDGDMTSVVEDSHTHVHQLDDMATSPPIALEDLKDEHVPMVEEDAARRKKKRTKKSKRSWGY